MVRLLLEVLQRDASLCVLTDRSVGARQERNELLVGELWKKSQFCVPVPATGYRPEVLGTNDKQRLPYNVHRCGCTS